MNYALGVATRLVNGDFTVQHLRALVLRLKGYQVDTASSLDEARNVISPSKYQLVIVDVGHFAGPELRFCEELKKQYPHQKLLMQVDYHLFLFGNTCPDKVISREEGPQHFIAEVEKALSAA
ncbi:MAG TPA: response regulator [Candidatus Angelobacter sp.]